MAASHSTQWFWSDWLGDQEVRRLTPAERGMWIDLLGLAAVGNPIGYVCDDRGRPLPLDEIRRVTNAASVEEVSELIAAILAKGAASRDRSGRLFNRRMVRDAALSARRAKSGRLGGERTALKWQHFNSVLGQMPQLVPRQPKAPLTLKESKKASSEPGGEEEGENVVDLRTQQAIERMRNAKTRTG